MDKTHELKGDAWILTLINNSFTENYLILIFKKYGLALFLVCSLLSHIIKLSYQLVVQKLNLAFARIFFWSFWLVDTPVEIFWPHEISLNVVSSLTFLIPLLESPLVIVFPYLRKPLSQIFQENGFSFYWVGNRWTLACSPPVCLPFSGTSNNETSHLTIRWLSR